jgi:glutaminyl-peptide cyclotransferase
MTGGMRTRRLLPLLAALVVLAAAGVAVAALSHGDEPRAAAHRVDRFDSARAWAFLRHQVQLGPRPAGSPALRSLAEEIRARLPHGRFERVPGHPGLRNVVGHIAGSRPAVVVAAHYDTKALPGFVGAEDGAGGTAAVLELARALRRVKRPAGAPELRFVFFDGEENPDDAQDFYAGGDRGSKAYARRHAKQTRALVLLDFVADRDLSIPHEAGSNPRLWKRLRAAARRVGSARQFPVGTIGTVTDDHTPFTRRRIPAIDLIDFTYPCWHKACDDLAHVSERSLDRSGEAVLELLRTWR